MAALCVAVYHNQFFFDRHAGFFDWAWINVDLFFLISGIVLTHVYEIRILERKTDFAVFLAHRVARLWPLHIFAMATVAVMELSIHFTRTGFHFHIAQNAMNWDAVVYTFFLNIFFLQNVGLFNGASWDSNGWSLTPEIILNLVWFHLLVSRRLSSKLLFFTILICAIIQYNLNGSLGGDVLDSRIIRSAISFGGGCLLYRHLIQNPALPGLPVFWSNLLSLIVTLLLLSIMVSVATDWGHRSFIHWDWICVLFLFPSLTYLALQERNFLNLFFASRPLTFLGYISYSVYLLHVQIGVFLARLCEMIYGAPPPTPVLGIIYLIVVCGFSYLAYRFIENPSRAFLRPRLEAFFEKLCLLRAKPGTPELSPDVDQR